MSLYDFLPKGGQVKCFGSGMRELTVGMEVPSPIEESSYIVILREGGYIKVVDNTIMEIIEDGQPFYPEQFLGEVCVDKWGERHSTLPEGWKDGYFYYQTGEKIELPDGRGGIVTYNIEITVTGPYPIGSPIVAIEAAQGYLAELDSPSITVISSESVTTAFPGIDRARITVVLGGSTSSYAEAWTIAQKHIRGLGELGLPLEGISISRMEEVHD